ncbi:MAG: hypothetical protein HGA28_00515 [Anaerolineaceae bacterium]|nr:hypothetical protein [Anaerolineaceae bacterium]
MPDRTGYGIYTDLMFYMEFTGNHDFSHIKLGVIGLISQYFFLLTGGSGGVTDRRKILHMGIPLYIMI